MSHTEFADLERRTDRRGRLPAGVVSPPRDVPAPTAHALHLALLGCVALGLGWLVYAADRDTSRVLLFPSLATLHTGPLFGSAGFWLPSFVHPFAFSLFTAAALSPSARPAYGACAAWWAVNICFEIAQYDRFSAAVADALQRQFGQGALADALASYLLRGSFDRADIVAATAGSLAAAAVLSHLQLRAKDGHGH